MQNDRTEAGLELRQAIKYKGLTNVFKIFMI